MILENYPLIVDYGKSSGDSTSAQTDLFGALDTGIEQATIEFPPTPAATGQQKLEWEKETLGLYVSSHPLAGLRKYISRKAQLIGDLTQKNIGKKGTLAGMVESVKTIRTKKGDTMAIVMLEDPTGKMEVTLFPKTYAEAAPMLGQPDTVLVLGGVIDYRAGQLQMRVDAIKRSSLSAMIKKAKEDGVFDEEEAKRGLSVMRKTLEMEEEVEAVDEEGNAIAGEKIKVSKETAAEGGDDKKPDVPEADVTEKKEPGHMHTITLPARAPKQLLLDLKRVLETYPGGDPVQLKIGEQMIMLPLTVTMSPILEKRIADLLATAANQ